MSPEIAQGPDEAPPTPRPPPPGGPGPSEIEEAVRTSGQLARTQRRRDDVDARNLDLLVFAIGGGWFGVDVGEVAEVISAERLTPMPRTPPHVVGVLAYRGEVIAVIQLRELPGHTFIGEDDEALVNRRNDDEHRLVILSRLGMTVGLLIDGRAEILSVPETSLQPRPDAFQVEESDVVAGYIDREDGVITVLKADQLLLEAKLKR